MRHLHLLLWTVLIAAGATAQEQSDARVNSESTYRTRSIESLPPSQAEAAMNLATEPSPAPSYLLDQYRLERRSRYSQSGRALSGRDQNALDAQLTAMEQACGNTPAYAFAHWEHNGFLKQDYQTLKQVSATVADASLSALDRTLADAVHAAIYSDDSALEQALASMSSQHSFAPASSTLQKNALHSAQANSIMITHGFEDTFALLQHQRAGLRKDVLVVHLDWLRNPDYAQRIYQQVGAVYAPATGPDDHLKALVKAAQFSTRPFYLSTTLPAQALKRFDGDLYPEGVLLRCHKPLAFDNILATFTWWEQRADRSHIQSGAAINRNYLIALAVLNNFYTAGGEQEKSREVQGLLQALTPSSEQQSRVKQVTSY